MMVVSHGLGEGPKRRGYSSLSIGNCARQSLDASSAKGRNSIAGAVFERIWNPHSNPNNGTTLRGLPASTSSIGVVRESCRRPSRWTPGPDATERRTALARSRTSSTATVGHRTTRTGPSRTVHRPTRSPSNEPSAPNRTSRCSRVGDSARSPCRPGSQTRPMPPSRSRWGRRSERTRPARAPSNHATRTSPPASPSHEIPRSAPVSHQRIVPARCVVWRALSRTDHSIRAAHTAG